MQCPTAKLRDTANRIVGIADTIGPLGPTNSMAERLNRLLDDAMGYTEQASRPLKTKRHSRRRILTSMK